MWLTCRGEPLTSAAPDHHVRRWGRLRRRPLAAGASTHAFRRTVAMQLIDCGEPVNGAQALLGHASLSSTQIYIRVASHHVREAADACPSGASCGRWVGRLKHLDAESGRVMDDAGAPIWRRAVHRLNRGPMRAG